jgi:hypothetical protein
MDSGTDFIPTSGTGLTLAPLVEFAVCPAPCAAGELGGKVRLRLLDSPVAESVLQSLQGSASGSGFQFQDYWTNVPLL